MDNSISFYNGQMSDDYSDGRKTAAAQKGI